nr:reverse transcriptase domain-containing protein [Tanacetum cinerariifolium]
MLSHISFHVLIRQGSRCVFPTFPIVFRPFKTLCFFNYALMIRQDYDITSSLRRGALQRVSKDDFLAYVKANDVVMRNMQTQGQNMQNQLTNLTNLITKFVNSNNASTSSSGTLPSNTIAKPRSDLEAITTRSGVTKDTVNPTNNENTKDVQPQLVQSESLILTSKLVTSPISKPAIAPVSASKPNLKTSIPYLSRRNDERNREKANNQIEKFYQIFKDMSFKISFPDALILIPKFASTLKSLIGNKEKLSELARTPLSLPDLTPMCMTLELADRSISRPVGVAEDVYVKVGELTLRVIKEAITFNLDQTSRYSANYSDMTEKRIDVIDMACEEYSQEVLGFSDTILSGNPTSFYDPIVSMTSSTLTPFENSDFLLEEVDAFLAIEDEPTSSEFYQPYLNPEGDILLLEAFLNDDPSLPPLNQRNYMPEVHKELKIFEAKSDKSLVNEPPTVELKDLAPHLEYTFLEGDDNLPVIIAKDLKEDFEPAVQHQRRVNPKIHDVIKQEVIKLLEAGLIYPISDSPWVSPVHCVPKKGGFTVVENKDNKLIPTRLVTGRRICIDYRKFNEATRKDHFPLPFMDHMLERLAGNQYYCFLDGFSGYFQIPIDPKDQEKTTFTCPYRTFAYRCMPFGLCNAPGTFQRKLTEAPILIAPNWDMPVELMCDASDFAIRAVLGQRQDKHFRPIHYASKTMTEAKSNYTTTKKEMLAVVYAIEKFRSYLILNKSIVYTDHSALKYLFAKKHSKDKLDDALWAFRTTYKTPIGCTPYKLVYGKECHPSVELEHKAY